MLRRSLSTLADSTIQTPIWPSSLLIAALLASAARAAHGEEPAAEAPSVSARDAGDIVRQRYGGRLVSTVDGELERDGKKTRGYWVRIDVHGRIERVFVDRRGRIHEDRAEDDD